MGGEDDDMPLISAGNGERSRDDEQNDGQEMGDASNGLHVQTVSSFDEYKRLHPSWFHELPSKGERTVMSYVMYPFRKLAAHKRRMVANFTWRFLIMLLSAYLLVKGLFTMVKEIS